MNFEGRKWVLGGSIASLRIVHYTLRIVGYECEEGFNRLRLAVSNAFPEDGDQLFIFIQEIVNEWGGNKIIF